MKQVIFSADDFGLTPAVNEAIERAHREGILDQASLMVAGPPPEDAVRPPLPFPAGPPAAMTRLGARIGIGDRALFVWTRLLRHQARLAGMITSDHCFGLAWSGHMTHDPVRRLLRQLPDGTSEIYFHPGME